MRSVDEWRTKPANRQTGNPKPNCNPKWTAPQIGYLKLNSDAALFQDGLVGLGFVIRNDRSEVIVSGSRRQPGGGGSTLVEALALCFGIRIANECGLSNIIFESDSESLIKAINGELIEDPYVMSIIREIQRLATQVNGINFRFARREANSVAHHLAHFCNSSETEFIWMDDVPVSCAFLVQNDVRLMPAFTD